MTLAEREWLGRSPHWLALPFGDLSGLWRYQNPIVLNKLGVFGMFPMNRDLDHT
jgi:hypothetical protein